MKKRIWLDCDPGVDDVLAILLADSKEELELIAISAVSGNVSLEHTEKNARRTVAFLGRDIPVYRGASRPLIREAVYASRTHGEDGLGGYEHHFDGLKLPASISEDVFRRMAEAMLAEKEPFTLVAIGPLTNVALLFLAHPEVKEKIDKISIMGGALTTGNTTPRAEFNFYVDPEAVAVVLQCGIPIVMAGLDVTEQALITEEEIHRFSKIVGPRGAIALDMLRSYAAEDGALHDPVAILALTNPELFEGEEVLLAVDTSDGGARGQSYPDRRIRSRAIPRNVYALTKINRDGFLNELKKMFRKLDGGVK